MYLIFTPDCKQSFKIFFPVRALIIEYMNNKKGKMAFVFVWIRVFVML